MSYVLFPIFYYENSKILNVLHKIPNYQITIILKTFFHVRQTMVVL